MGAIQKRIRDVRCYVYRDGADQLVWRSRQYRQDNMARLGSCRVVQQVLLGLVGVIVMDRTIVLMVVLDVFDMLHFMRDRRSICSHERSPLQSKAM